MNALREHLERLRKEGRKALSLYVTPWYPSREITIPLVTELSHHGADLIELGIPFSDPIADGPVIQASSEIALRNGITLGTTLEIARTLRSRISIPILLMGYANPIFRFGLSRFVDACSEAGVSGAIIPDLPLEESDDYRRCAEQKNFGTVFLASPVTPDQRLSELDRASTGFLYCVSITGVTGERANIASAAQSFLERARRSATRNPLLVGFGISSPSDALAVAALSDGVIIGSSLMKLLGSGPADHSVERAVNFVKPIRRALDDGRVA